MTPPLTPQQQADKTYTEAVAANLALRLLLARHYNPRIK